MRTKKWIITSCKMDKTIVVAVHTYKNHPKYKKSFRVTSKFYAHDENNSCLQWDIVIIKESKPLSKTKRWVFVEKAN